MLKVCIFCAVASLAKQGDAALKTDYISGISQDCGDKTFHFYLVSNVMCYVLTVITCRLILRGWRPTSFKEQYPLTLMS